MISALVSRLIVLTFGTLYPAYASYKAVRTKNVKEYVKWMMYWIVYAFFTCIETVTDIFLSWFPFYYEIKIVIVLWLLSPATKGSSTLYRKFVHPMLTRREQEIDEYLNQAKERGYSAVLQLGYTGVTYAKNVIMQSALKYAFGSSNNEQETQNILLPANSNNNLYDQRAVMVDDHDSIIMKTEFCEEADERIDNGAARSRERPVRRGRKASSSTKSTNERDTVKAVRTRRKLREATPDNFVDVE
ncbi:receptor expression-enhancing protein 1-like isoform X3 [Teleopsis dalmanni]|uniref:receptor expression-enhancing protein 1-like isoform X3 n=1 Tax=Teleopsis dalmanni TaxID=139649 RepID=UPI0018CCE7D6|nr:receptor expression-enhancing protein 1-like isoform X3 [Teleopsis dalmanni]